MVKENATLDFKILSLNSRGIRSPEKRQALLICYVHQLEKKLMNSNNKVADQESKWEKFQLFCCGSEK